MSQEQQDEYLALVAKGLPSSLACGELSVSTAAVLATLDGVPEFRARSAQTRVLLSQNVLAALYRAALKGSVPAQTLWLKNLPPPEWASPADRPQSSTAAPSDSTSSADSQEITDVQLLTRFLAAEGRLPPEIPDDLRQLVRDHLRTLAHALGPDQPADVPAAGDH